jgi:hypothetical protein
VAAPTLLELSAPIRASIGHLNIRRPDWVGVRFDGEILEVFVQHYPSARYHPRQLQLPWVGTMDEGGAIRLPRPGPGHPHLALRHRWGDPSTTAADLLVARLLPHEAGPAQALCAALAAGIREANRTASGPAPPPPPPPPAR